MLNTLKKILNQIIKVLFIGCVLYASYLLILLSLPYTSFVKDIEFLETKQLIYHLKLWRVSFYIHVFSSSIVILSGLFQFNKYLIHRQKKIHKILGYSYFISVLLISGPSALVMSFYANGGLLSQISFVILSTLWIVVTAISFLSIKKKNIENHGNWILRSYSLTLSAVTLRFYAYLFDIFNIPLSPTETYTLLTWISWIPNLIIAEIMIKKGFIKNIIN